MKKINLALFCGLMLSALQATASPYPLGSMTCDDIGIFASQAMQWREDGMTIPQAKAKLEELKPEDSVEKENMTNVIGFDIDLPDGTQWREHASQQGLHSAEKS